MSEYVSLQEILERQNSSGTPCMSGTDFEYMNTAGSSFVKRYIRHDLLHSPHSKSSQNIIAELRDQLTNLQQQKLVEIIIENFHDADGLSIISRIQQSRGHNRGKFDNESPIKEQLADYLNGSQTEVLVGLREGLPTSRNLIWIDFMLEHALPERKMFERAPIETRLDDLAESLALSPLERKLVLVLYCLSMRDDLQDIEGMRNSFNEQIVRGNLHVFLECTKVEAARAISNDGILRTSGLLVAHKLPSVELSEEASVFLAGFEGEKFFDSVLHRVESSDVTLAGSSLPEDDKKLLVEVLAKNAGAQVLLYGLAGHGKTCLAIAAAHAAGRKVYQIQRKKDENFRAKQNLLRSAAIILRRRADVVLMVDEADKILCTESVWSRFGEHSDKAWLNDFMDTCDASVIWITNEVYGIADSTQRRFDLSFEFQELTTNQRHAVFTRILSDYPDYFRDFGDDELWRLATDYVLPPSVIKETATRVRGMQIRETTAQRILLFRRMLDTAVALRGGTGHGKATEHFRPCENYSLEGLNLDVDPAGIGLCVTEFYKYLAANPSDKLPAQLNILFVGPPGTGKTELVKYLAAKSGRDVIIKRASDLLNMYVGQTEKLIAAAFRQAEQSGSILFIDEADSLFHDREGAQRSWEVSQTNELLQQMERFRGMLICATNNLGLVDGAAFRRFSIKARFDYLQNTGKISFFRNFFPQHELTGNDEDRLKKMQRLAPGDFKAVSQRFKFRVGVPLTTEEVLKALESENSFKDRKSGRLIGFT